MTDEQKKYIELLTAEFEGNQMQFEVTSERWINETMIDLPFNDFKHGHWRIKPEPTYAELQAEHVEKINLKPGDKVRVVRTWSRHEQGFTRYMGSVHINEIYDIDEINDDCLFCSRKENDTDVYARLPFFAIEKLSWRPYKKVKKEWIGKVIKSKDKEEYFMITGVRSNGNYQTIWRHNDSGESVINCFDYYTELDGSPFGEQDDN